MEVRVLRGRADDPTADRERAADLLARTAETGQPAVRVWTPHRQVAFGRRDANTDGYRAARRAAEKHGFTPIERSVGGRAVAYTGHTLAFAHAIPIDDLRSGMGDRYNDVTAALLKALRGVGADVVRGEPDGSYCPGDHSISAADAAGEPTGKVVGIAQRIRAGAALVSGCVTVAAADEPELRGVLNPVYKSLGVPFAANSVGSVSGAGGPDDPEAVARAIEDALINGRDCRIEHL